MGAVLGAFELLGLLGKGGMGEVWRARHQKLDRDVAVKIDLHPPAVEAAEAFLHEVAIIAGLDHPNVARILEHGTVPGSVQAETGGHFREGARWLAMELAPGGSVQQHAPRTWDEIAFVMRQTLAALGHAHARGVVHRDIKPANLLIAGPEEGIDSVPESLLDGRILLSDFGVSELRDQPSTDTMDAVGTPLYMPPEQIEARWRDQGPWTDLYAMGILLWRLTTGTHPFPGENAFRVFRGHLFSPVPRPTLLPGMPADVEPILRRCLAKEPRDRYRFAIDLWRDLETLTGTAHALPVSLEDLPTERGSTDAPTQDLTSGSSTLSKAREAGLSLFGLQVPPLVGRADVVGRLGSALDATLEAGSCRVVVLRGAQGLGRTRLARSLGQSAHEQGRAVPWFVACLPGQDPGEAFRSVARHELRLEGLEPAERSERLREVVGDAVDPVHLSNWLGDDERFRARLPPREQRALALRLLGEVARDQPLVLVLDDAHHDPEALELVDHLLARQHRTPSRILVVLTVQEQGLLQAPRCRALLDDLIDDPAVQQVELAPLDPAARRSLSRSLVGLEGGVSQRLEERTAGNPQFVVELVRTWIDEGILTPGPRGFQLDRDAEQAMPLGLERIWQRRIDDALADRSDDDRMALQAAACLGPSVRNNAWAHVCQLLELTPRRDLYEHLTRAGLIHGGDHGSAWSFSHALVREVLARQAREQNHWIDLNLAVAIHLTEWEVHAPAQLARHLLAAHEHERAIEPLFQAIYDMFDRGDTRDRSLFELLRGSFDALDLPDDDARRGRLDVIEAMALRESEGAAAELPVLEGIESRYHAPEVRALAVRERARAHYRLGEHELAHAYAARAIEAFEELGQGRRAADSMQLQGNILARLGRLDEARTLLLRALEALEGNGWVESLYDPLYSLAQLEQQHGDPVAAEPWLERLDAYTRSRGMQALHYRVLNFLGENARARGDAEAAAGFYTEAAELGASLDDPGYVFPLLNLGLLDIQAGRHRVAVGRMQRVLAELRRSPRAVPELFAQVVLFAAAANAGDLPTAMPALKAVMKALDELSVADKDLAKMAESGAWALARRGHPAASLAFEIAIDQLERMGRAEQAAALRASIPTAHPAG